MLQLTRNLIVFDTEWHDIKEPEEAYIVEIGFLVINPKNEIEREFNQFLCPPVAITKEATAVHGITNEMVEGKPRFKQVAEFYAKGFSNCDFCGYNIRADIRILSAEMHRSGIQWSAEKAQLWDPYKIWGKQKPRTLTDAVREFLNRDPSGAHRAVTDAKDAYEVGMAQLQKWPEIPRELSKIHDLCFDKDALDPEKRFIWIDGVIVCNFGKYKSKALKWIADKDRQYLEKFILGSNFTWEVKNLVRNALEGIYPERKE